MSPELNKSITKQVPAINDHGPLNINNLIKILRDSQNNKDLILTFLAEMARSAATLTEADTQTLKAEMEKLGIKVTQE